MLSDTSPDAQRVQIELLRKATVAEQITKMRCLTALATRLSRQAIAEANPQLGRQGVDLLWVELHYGKDLAVELRQYFSRQQACDSRTSSKP